MSLLSKVFGSKNQRELKKLLPVVQRINDLRPTMEAKSDAQLRAMTSEFRQRLEQGATLDDVLPEAFATVREASWRTLKMRHFDVQLMGGMVLHQGKIAEMRTGEGKTLTATLPIYLNALEGRGVHLVTVNDYLARRDAEWMGQIYGFLGMSTGVVVHGLEDWQRQRAYLSDITYGQNNEFGFDYLRDNMKMSPDRMVQRGHRYSLVDEVDSILIDEARTPLIISGPSEQSADLYSTVDRVVPRLKRDVDYTVDEKAHAAMLTDQGVERVEKLLGLKNLYDPANIAYNHHVTQALARAHAVQARRQLPDRRRQDHHHRRVHRQKDAGPALVRRPAPGHRGEGRRGDRGGEPDPRHHHLPELLPPVRQALRHDRHGGHRGGRVPPHLQARGDGGADEQGDDPRRHAGPGLQEREGQVPRGVR